jgi:putative ABC transport system permease protein
VLAVALKGLLGRKLRATLTAFAIVLGVAMVSGSFVLTDTLRQTFDRIFDESYENADVVVSSTEAPDAGDDETPAFSAELQRDVEALPSVAETLGSVEDDAALVGHDGDLIAGMDNSIGFGVDGSDDSALNPFRLVRGRWPTANGEVGIDVATAKDERFDVGDRIGVVAGGPRRDYRITSIVQFGTTTSIGGATIAVFALAPAQRLFGKVDQLDRLQVAGKPDATPAELIGEIRPLLPPETQVQTASAQAESDSGDTSAGLDIIKYFLLAFGGIALFVGSFVIANTMSITVAQRMRELATLRTIGASRRQVLTSVVVEAVVVGFIASVIGLFLGLALAKGLNELLVAAGVDLPSGSLVFATRTIVVSLLVGTGIALLASLRPGLRATRVPPIAAVREGAVLPPSRLARFGLATALSVIGIAVAILGYGVFKSGVAIGMRLLLLGVGVLLLFVGVALLAPRVVGPLAGALGWPGSRLGGAAGTLARDNARRNPARTASTAAALMIGLALVTFVAILGQGLRASFTDAVDELFVADYALTAGDDQLPESAVAAARRAPGVQAVSAIIGADGHAFGEDVHVNGVQPNLGQVGDMTWARGSSQTPAELGRNGSFVKEEYADDQHLTVGSPLPLEGPDGQIVTFRVVGIFDEPKGGSPFGEVGISSAALKRIFPEPDNDFTFVNMLGGTNDRNTATLERALAEYPGTEVETRDTFKDSQLATLSTTLNVLYGLLGLSVIVSLFGIVNTLVLSVFERTRELGMLRAVGMTRRQVRRMIRQEAIVTCLIGATLGIAVGMFLAALVTRALSDEGIVFAVPYGTLLVFVLVAIAAGMLAAILPARRASRLNVLHALQYE